VRIEHKKLEKYQEDFVERVDFFFHFSFSIEINMIEEQQDVSFQQPALS